MKKKSPRAVPDFSRKTQGKKGVAKPGAQPAQQPSSQPTGRKAIKPQSTSAKSGHRG